MRVLPLLLPLFLATVEASASGPRALWVVRDTLLSPKTLRQMVDDAERAGITDLFLQVRGRGDAYYLSERVPVAPQLREAWTRFGRYDPLEEVLQLARERGIRVHAWLNVYLAWSGAEPPAGHVVATHPEWIARDARGDSMKDMDRDRFKEAFTEGIYLDPGNAGVVRDFLGVVDEILARYPVAGIHLDYVRYPEMDVGYGDAMRRAFRERAGIDPLELVFNERGLRKERGDAGYRALRDEWTALRAEQITALVRAVRKLLRSTGREAILSAAVKPDPESAARVSQDWPRWVREDLVDVVAPMMYSPDPRVVRRQAEALARLVPPGRVWAGIAVYNQSLSQAESNILACRRAGIDGISIFSYNSLPGGGRNLVRLAGAR